MTFNEKLRASWAKSGSLLCVGLDPDLDKVPPAVATSERPLFAFCRGIIDATADLVCAFKPNSAFFEAHGSDGMSQLEATFEYLATTYPDVVTIDDAKRADIGNTNAGYVRSIYDGLQADAVTLHPYLGREALAPFLDNPEKGCVVLCRTSNPGAGELQDLVVDGRPLYQALAANVASTWNVNRNCALVVGATYPDEMREVRRVVGSDLPLLVLGVGAQGGDVEAVVKAGRDDDGTGMIINSSRAILYASQGDDFADAARSVAMRTRDEINQHRGA